MKAIGEILKEKNLQLDTDNLVWRGGFTQIPNFILKDSKLSVGAKVAYAMFLSYAWHNDSCFPAGQAGRDDIAARLAKFCFVKVHQFEKPGTQPEHLSADEVAQLFGGVA